MLNPWMTTVLLLAPGGTSRTASFLPHQLVAECWPEGLLFSAQAVTSLDLLPGLFFQFLESPILSFFAMLSLWYNLRTIRCTHFQVYDSMIFNKRATITIQFQHLLITHLQSLLVPFWQWEAWVIFSHYRLGELTPKERAQRGFIQIKKLYLNEVAATKTLLSPKTPAPITALALVHKSPQQEEVW